MFIFDFDGVIADSLACYQKACQAAAATQNSSLQLPSNPFANLSIVTFEALAESHQLAPKRFSGDVTQHIKENTILPPLFDGMADTLKVLAQEQTLFILSATHTAILQSICQHHHIAQYISGMIGGDINGSKGEKITKLLKPKAANGETVIMVGDSVSDIDAAHAANIPAVAVTWGWQSADKLRSHGANHMVDTPNQLLELLIQLSGSSLSSLKPQ